MIRFRDPLSAIRDSSRVLITSGVTILNRAYCENIVLPFISARMSGYLQCFCLYERLHRVAASARLRTRF